jgi:hypothetical protein
LKEKLGMLHWDSERRVLQQENFPHKDDSGILSNSRGSLRLVLFLCSSSNLQQQINSATSPTNYGGCQAPIARKISKTKGNNENKVFVFFKFKNRK